MVLRPQTALSTVTVSELVEQNLPLVGHLVREILSRVPAHVRRDDLTSAAMMGLTVAAQGFDATRGVPFPRYAAIRIRGALVDELRGMDWAARSVRTRGRELDAVRSQLTAALRRTPRREEIAAALGITTAELAGLDNDIARANPLSLQGFAPESGPDTLPDHHDGPEALLVLREQLGYLHDAIDLLPERLRYVVTAYFFEQRHMADIGAELGVSESRISQLRAEALTLIRDGLNAHLEPTAAPSRRGRRSAVARQSYVEALGAGTVKSRLARTNAQGEMRRHHCAEALIA